jgi:hypothetical protein
MHLTPARVRAGAQALAAAAFIVLLIILAGCSSSGSSDAGAAKSAAASVTANPQFLAAKALVKHCFAGTPVQQARQIHLVFLSSATGKNGPEVVAARAKTADCMGISKSDEKPFFNDAVTAAEHQKPRLSVLHPVAWITAFFTKTLPPIVIKYSNAPGVGNGTANVPGLTTPASPSATGSTP